MARDLSCDLSPSSSKSSRENPTSLTGSVCQGSGSPTGATISVYLPRGPSPGIEPRNPATSPGRQRLKHHSFIHVPGTVLKLGNGCERESQRAMDAPKMGFHTGCWSRQRPPREAPFPSPSAAEDGQHTLSRKHSRTPALSASCSCILSRYWGEEGRPGCLGPHGHVYPGWNFFNPKVKVFLFETSIYIPE